MPVSDTFVATGGERYITIGNFYNDANTMTDTVSGTWYNAYYYIDDVSVVDCGYVGINETENGIGVLLFPNPSSGTFTLSGNFPAGAQLSVYNMLGKEVMNPIELPQGNSAVPISLNLLEGVYFYRVESPDTILTEGKIEIVN